MRENVGGKLETLVYGCLVAANADPIEKKPLFHVAPASRSFSIAAPGCNFRCAFCQNYQIAQIPDDFRPTAGQKAATPQQVVDEALATGCKSIAYTYTEPTVFFEFALDTARLAKKKGLRNVFITNGYMSAAAADLISPYLDAANVDLKAFTADFYKAHCKARLSEVKKSLVHMKRAGIFIEVTTLVIPEENDDPAELADLAGFIASELGPDTPWHVSRFHPTYRLTHRGPTPEKTLFFSQGGRGKGRAFVCIHRQHPRPGRGRHLLPLLQAPGDPKKRVFRDKKPPSKRGLPRVRDPDPWN